jgi:hypothetical protein
VTAQDVAIAKAAVAEVRAKMDPETLARVRPVTVGAKPKPDPQDFERGCFAGQKAAYYGVPCELGIQGAQELPSGEPATGEITLFLDNLAPVTPERCFIAILHEYMHALGYDEETIEAMGLWLDGGPPCTPF